MLRRLSHSFLTVLVVVTLLALLLIATLVYKVATDSVSSFEDYIIESRQMETDSATNLLSKDVEALYTLMYNELSDVTLTKLRLFFDSSTLNWRYLELTKIVESQLYSIETAMNFAQSVEIYLPDYQRLITSASLTRYDPSQASWLSEPWEGGGSRVLTEDRQLIFMTRKHTGTSRYGYDVAVVARVQEMTMQRYLRRFTDSQEETQVALFLGPEEDNRLFVSSGSLRDDGQIAGLIAGSDRGNAEYRADSKRYLLTWNTTGLVPLKVCQITPMELIDTQLHSYRANMLSTMTAVVLLMLLLVTFVYLIVLKPLSSIQAAFKRVEDGDLSTRIAPTWSNEFQQMFGRFNRMAEHLQGLIEREYELRLLNFKAEIKQMRYQINPHFLYNTYFNLRAMLVDEEYDEAARLSDLMGRYLRYITISDKEFATLKEELDHSLAYMEIQQLRFGSRLETRVGECPPTALEANVPRLILQPLIENAFEHGVKDQPGNGIIAISFREAEGAFSIFVEDNGCHASDEMIAHLQGLIQDQASSTEGDGVALLNIHRRLTMLYPEGSGLYVSRSSLGGFRSEIRMMEVDGHVPHADC